ncbi:ankyrin repeat domain-containing protein [Thiofilum flexile]|uniref:ankyrin repeat domain-containing protein n=1 Tax=Thiofilum flexile TaxID=125627 RepID=UPI0003652E79|nr:ankyrin repeat domain-containing protein [Thiofilum flexile]
MFKAVLRVLGIGLWCFSANAHAYLYSENPDPCEDYALKSVNQYAIAKLLRCPVSGLRWNANEKGQVRWCNTARTEVILGETRARAETLLRCMGNPAPLNPDDLTKVSNTLGEEMNSAVMKDNIKRVMQLAAAGWSMQFQGNAGNDGLISFIAIANNAEKSARFFLEKLKMDPNSTSNGGPSNLYYVINRPRVNYQFLEYLLKHKADPNSTGESSSNLPLNMAVDKRDLRAAQLLLKYGADAKGSIRGCLDTPPLARAIKKNDAAMIQLLKKHGAKETDECMLLR